MSALGSPHLGVGDLWELRPETAVSLCGLLTSFPAGKSEDWVQTPAWPLPGYVMLVRLSLSLLICLVGPGRRP